MESITRRLAAVAFADVAGWSRLVESNELEALRAWNDLRTRLIEPMLREHGGRLVDLAGDAVFVEFASAIDAVNWALGLQRRESPVLPMRRQGITGRADFAFCGIKRTAGPQIRTKAVGGKRKVMI